MVSGAGAAESTAAADGRSIWQKESPAMVDARNGDGIHSSETGGRRIKEFWTKVEVSLEKGTG